MSTTKQELRLITCYLVIVKVMAVVTNSQKYNDIRKKYCRKSVLSVDVNLPPAVCPQKCLCIYKSVISEN